MLEPDPICLPQPQRRCVDVAALFAAAILRRNPDSVVVPFDTQAYQVRSIRRTRS